jgi:hypothetical protein
MVIEPVVTTLDITLPLKEPNRALDNTATLAVPPLADPRMQYDRLRKKLPPPEACKATPKIMKPINIIPKTLMGIPNMLWMLKEWNAAVVLKVRPCPSMKPGIWGAKRG